MSATGPDMATFLLGRALQGIGGGSLMPMSQAIVREKFPPEEQAMSMALYTMGVILAPAVGPVVGGLIIDDFGWPWIFYINVPVGAVALMLCPSGRLGRWVRPSLATGALWTLRSAWAAFRAAV